MQEVNEQFIISELKNHENEIFMAITPWHAKSMEASYLRYRTSSTGSPLVICMCLDSENPIINESNFTTLSNGSSFYKYHIKRFNSIKNLFDLFFTTLKFIFSRKHSKGTDSSNDVYLYTTRDIPFYFVMRVYNSIKNCNITNYICDEGIASSYDAYNLKQEPFIKRKLSRIVSKRITIVRDEFLNIDDNGVHANYDLRNRYLNVFKTIKVDFSPFNVPKEKYALLCYAPIDEETEMVDKNQFEDIIHMIVDINNQHGRKTVIKMHPREKNIQFYKELGCIVWNGKYSLEEIMANIDNKPSFVIGGTSTGLVTSNILFGINSISTILLYEKCNKEGFAPSDLDKYIGDVNQFADIYKEYVKFPKSSEELINYLK